MCMSTYGYAVYPRQAKNYSFTAIIRLGRAYREAQYCHLYYTTDRSCCVMFCGSGRTGSRTDGARWHGHLQPSIASANWPHSYRLITPVTTGRHRNVFPGHQRAEKLIYGFLSIRCIACESCDVCCRWRLAMYLVRSLFACSPFVLL